MLVVACVTITVSSPHITIKRLVDQAIFGVAKSALICPGSYLEPLLKILYLSLEDERAPIARSGASSSSTVSEDACPLNLASLWMTSTASASRPMPERKRGLSSNVKMKNRIAHRKRVIPPRVNNRYRHPILSDLVQFEALAQE